jgi:alpha-tubulin suppressor-like RCC1 family protein
MTILLDLPLEVIAAVCEQLSLRELVHLAETCKGFHRGDGGLETMELPTKSAVVTALREHAFPGGELSPSTRPDGSESWVSYLSRCARQRICQEMPLIAAGYKRSLFADVTHRLLATRRTSVGGDQAILKAVRAGIRVRSVALSGLHSLALTWDGRVYSWGHNEFGQLGHGDQRFRPSPRLVKGLEGVRGVAADVRRSLAVTHSGAVFIWGSPFQLGMEGSLRPIIVNGFEGVRVHRLFAGQDMIFAIGESGELFSWGDSGGGRLGHGNSLRQFSPKRVEALRGVRVRSGSAGVWHALALSEDGLVYAWGENDCRSTLGNPTVESELLPKPVEALRGVRVINISAADYRNYAVADTGELWAWGVNRERLAPLGHGGLSPRRLPKPIASLRGIKIDAVAAGRNHTLALADDGSVYSWGNDASAEFRALGVHAEKAVHTPQRIPALRVAPWAMI